MTFILSSILISDYNTPVMYTDITGYFMVGVMIASIIVSLVIESIQDYTDDGILFNRSFNNYIGAGVSGFFSGLSGGIGYLMLYGFIGNSLDYFISGEFNVETLGRDLFIMGISSAMGVVIGKGLNLGLSKLKANSLFKLNNNPLANDILNKMGLTVKIGSRAADNLGRVIFDSGKYFFGLVIENVSTNIANNSMLIVFD